jgi:fructose-1,6-bisphosphatase/inositol monophosphatase family enzyme
MRRADIDLSAVLFHDGCMSIFDPAQVAAIIAEAAAIEIKPRFGKLAKSDIREKAPNDLVTIADEAMEHRLTRDLAALIPGSLVVGEEACAADPSVRDRLDGDGWVWVIDPVDGTSNFANGRPLVACLVALIHKGETVGGWIHDPLSGRMAIAERGAGVIVDGAPLGPRPPFEDNPAHWRGSMNTRFFPAEKRADLEHKKTTIAVVKPVFCAGQDYLRLLDGVVDFALFYRTLPWDHVAGALAMAESGGISARFDGAPYTAGQRDVGLLITRDTAIWEPVRKRLGL